MKERPILFSAPMVRALLAGTKTQTRRVVKPQPPQDAGEVFCGWYYPTIIDRQGHEQRGPLTYGAWTLDGAWGLPSPYGQHSDRLWVRETFAIVPRTAYACSEGVQQTLRPDDPYEHDAAIYREGWTRSKGGFSWRSSIHMPRWASRIMLQVTGVRVERLQDISEADAIAEGCTKNHNGYYWGGPHAVSGLKQMATADSAYRDLWESINGDGSWDANPWVWVVEFKKIAGGSL